MSLNTLSSTIANALAAAGLDPHSKPLAAVTNTIRNALNAAGLVQLPAQGPAANAPLARAATVPRTADAGTGHGPPAGRGIIDDAGAFIAFSHHNAKGRRDYKLYVPSNYDGQPMPLIVMLHGCKQNPDDFARGTRMNELAEQHGFLVAYPAQAVRANGGNCWNWFSMSEQARDGEEPSIIAGITRQVAASYAVDETRVFAAGLSAGAAMAAIVGARYPEVFRAVAVHSGLPLGAAHDVPSAFAAMQGRAQATPAGRVHAVPTLVFHGDADTTVVASNGRQVVEQAVKAFDVTALESLDKQVTPPRRVGDRDCTVTRYVDDSGHTQVESWLVSGAGHAWFGGSAEGSYTDAKGPNASEEMVRFFLSQRLSGNLAAC